MKERGKKKKMLEGCSGSFLSASSRERGSFVTVKNNVICGVSLSLHLQPKEVN